MSRIIKKVKNRLIKRNKNWLCVVCGATGSGKSYSAMRLAELIDPTFTIDRVVFSSDDFMRVLNNGMKKGQVLLWDEAGVGLSSREWYTIANKAINYVLQTFRHMNIGLIMTTPDFSFLDSQTRKLFHHYIETVGIDTSKNRVQVKFMKVSFNPRFGKEYFQYERFNRKAIKRLNISKPSKLLRKKYELKKKHFSKSLRDDVQKDVEIAKATKKHRRITDAEIMKTIKEEQIELNARVGEKPTS